MLINIDNLDKVLACIQQLPEVAIDCETFWTEGWDQRKIIGVSVYGEADNRFFSGYFPLRHAWEDVENLPICVLERLTKTLNEVPQHIYHNAKHDRQRFYMEGHELTAPFFDTMIASHMYDENNSHVLEDLAERFKIDTVANARKLHLHALQKQMLWHKIPSEVMVPYACGDARNTYYLAKKLRPILCKQELDKLWPTEEIYSDALMHMEITGIQIDPEMAEGFSLLAARRMGSIKKELGFDPAKPLPLATKLFKELGLPLPELGKPSKQFPRGRPTMNEATLERLGKTASGAAKQVMDLVLEYRGLQKARSTWYEGWGNSIDSTNRLHPVFHQHGTVNRRLSCVKPNMQQIPREDSSVGAAPNPKKLLRAPKGYELYELDYSQIEYRLAGVLSGDPIILNAYKSGSDMHQTTADRLGLTRQVAKMVNFLLIYEGGPTRLADELGITFENAKKIYSEYHNTYNTMFRYAYRVNATAQQRGWIRFWDGARRHYKHIFETKKAWNSLVQGGAARVIQKGIISIHQDKSLLAKMNSQVHDSIWAEIPSYAIHSELAKLKHHLEWPSRDSRFLIPFPTDVKRLA